jgi:hypothetical protein
MFPARSANKLEEAMKERERALAAGLESPPLFPEDDESDAYQMVLKRRKMAGILQQALRDEGLGDLAKRIRWKKEHLSEDGK